MVERPDQVRAVRVVDDGSYGPFPFWMAWGGTEAEVTLQLCGGVVSEVASIRVGDRFANAHDWGDNPWDDLRASEVDLLELVLRRR
jgi:hypothetical protein